MKKKLKKRGNRLDLCRQLGNNHCYEELPRRGTQKKREKKWKKKKQLKKHKKQLQD